MGSRRLIGVCERSRKDNHSNVCLNVFTSHQILSRTLMDLSSSVPKKAKQGLLKLGW